MTEENAIKLDMNSTVGFIGAGRLGTSVASALHTAEISVVAVNSRSLVPAKALAERIPGCQTVTSSQIVADMSDVVFITTGDAEISLIAREISWRKGQAVVHCSGARPLSDLAPAQESGARVGGIHPLQTFPTPDSADLIAGASAAVGSNDPGLLDWLQKIAHVLGANPFTIEEQHRAAYHASAVMACGLVASLMGLAAEVWAEMGVSRADALTALRPLTAATVEAVGREGLPEAITGPAVRGDVETIRMHIDAMKNLPANLSHAYSSLNYDAMQLFEERDGLSMEAAAEIKKLLHQSLEDHRNERRSS
ncbi:MAG: DUF2520 domain-containing protein [Dehalococcoidia bacterium]